MNVANNRQNLAKKKQQKQKQARLGKRNKVDGK